MRVGAARFKLGPRLSNINWGRRLVPEPGAGKYKYQKNKGFSYKTLNYIKYVS